MPIAKTMDFFSKNGETIADIYGTTNNINDAVSLIGDMASQ